MTKKTLYPVSTADFERIRTENYVYVDKTEYVYSLVTEGVFFFLGRPRRFGKSLLLSTLEAYFKGRKDLFTGLAIERLMPGKWESYPVLHLNLSGKSYCTPESLPSLLDMHIGKWEKEYGIGKTRTALDERFYLLIESVAKQTGKKVVVLIDEYDSPLSDTIDNPELQHTFRELLYGFYSVLKKAEADIKFCMLTGVTKFGKVSVFSGLNNLKDISFVNSYAGICGVTEEELRLVYATGIDDMAISNGWTREETLEKLKFHYDGYHFSRSLTDVYNPFSINNALYEGLIKDYWCASGLPTVLSKSLRKLDYDLEVLNGAIVDESSLSEMSMYTADPVSLFYQTGYLTLKSFDPVDELYTLGYPNREVERGIMNNVLKVYVPESSNIKATISAMRESLASGDPVRFIKLLNAFLCGVPSKLRRGIAKYENYYHTIFYCIASLIGLDTNVEYNTSEGYIDMIVRTEAYIYLIELKINGNALDALRQIDSRHYFRAFQTDERKLFKIGIGFSKKTHSIDSVEISED